MFMVLPMAHILDTNACVHGSTNGTNGIPISFKVLPMVPLVIPLVPMVMQMVPLVLPMVPLTKFALICWFPVHKKSIMKIQVTR